MNRILRRIAVAPLAPLVRTAASSYVVGEELPDAAVMALSLARQGSASAICYWDAEDEPPQHVASKYRETAGAIGRMALRSYLSIKAPSLAFDPELLGGVIDEARYYGLRVHFDSLGPEAVPRTYELIEEAYGRYSNLGCTLPGRWLRSPGDAEWACRLGLSVRVVKGQWPDAGTGTDPRAGFLRVVDALAGSARRVSVATHDPVLARTAIRKLQSAGTPCELELLFGLPSRAVLKTGLELAVPVRYYLPYGHAWLPYALRQARHNPRIIWWLVRDAWSGRLVHVPAAYSPGAE